MRSELNRLLPPALGVLLVVAGCTGDVADPPAESAPATTAPAEEPSPPELQDFSAEAARMASWSDNCAAFDLSPLLDQFGNFESADIESEPNPDPIQGGTWSGHCTAKLELDGSRAADSVWVVVDAFDTNVAAFEHYHDSASYTAERFSDDEIDYSTELAADTSWHASRLTAQEEPTVQSEERAMAVAVLLGDFYTVEILVRFGPGGALRAGCDPDTADDCALTATELAEFMATSGYLDDLHAAIEAAVEAGV
jgi:hypothetical protein